MAEPSMTANSSVGIIIRSVCVPAPVPSALTSLQRQHYRKVCGSPCLLDPTWSKHLPAEPRAKGSEQVPLPRAGGRQVLAKQLPCMERLPCPRISEEQTGLLSALQLIGTAQAVAATEHGAGVGPRSCGSAGHLEGGGRSLDT